MRRSRVGWHRAVPHVSIRGIPSFALVYPSLPPPARSRPLARRWLLSLVVSLLTSGDESEPLEHATRRIIYERLLLLPGDHFRSIARGLHLGHGSARYHLSVLVDRGLVTVEKVDGRARYFAVGPRAEPEKNAIYRKHWVLRDLRGRVLLAARQSQSPNATSVAEHLGISRQLAAYHLARLKESGLLKPEKGPHRR